MPDADLSSTLSGIRGRYAHGARITATGRDVCASADDVPLLVAAIDAVLKLADDWERETERLDALAQSSADPQSRAAISMRAQAFEECARKLREEAITRELSGTRQTQPGEDGES